jgi:hypothetical protein
MLTRETREKREMVDRVRANWQVSIRWWKIRWIGHFRSVQDESSRNYAVNFHGRIREFIPRNSEL